MNFVDPEIDLKTHCEAIAEQAFEDGYEEGIEKIANMARQVGRYSGVMGAYKALPKYLQESIGEKVYKDAEEGHRSYTSLPA